MKNKRKSKTKFLDIDIPLGSEIEFIYDDSYKAIVTVDNKVLFDDKIGSLSDITTKILQEQYNNSEKSRVNGFLYWKFQCEILTDRRLRIEKEKLISELKKIHTKD